MEPVQILVTLDRNYLFPLQVMFTSLFLNNPQEKFEVWLVHRSLTDEECSVLEKLIGHFGGSLRQVRVDDSLFENAPVSDRYPLEMYYRLLAPHLLPETVSRTLYLDPDILVINPVRSLWETDMEGYLFAAAAHTGTTELANAVNRIRLDMDHDYYNSGVLLINHTAGRSGVKPQAVFDYVEKFADDLMFPDQDILNTMFGDSVLELDDAIWNYDARNYAVYLLHSIGEANTNWVMRNTAILHFCGKSKPWNSGYRYRFGMLYSHYMVVTERVLASLAGF